MSHPFPIYVLWIPAPTFPIVACHMALLMWCQQRLTGAINKFHEQPFGSRPVTLFMPIPGLSHQALRLSKALRLPKFLVFAPSIKINRRWRTQHLDQQNGYPPLQGDPRTRRRRGFCQEKKRTRKVTLRIPKQILARSTFRLICFGDLKNRIPPRLRVSAHIFELGIVRLRREGESRVLQNVSSISGMTTSR